jgi:hypothetical protein
MVPIDFEIKIEQRNVDVPLVEVCDRFATVRGQ